MSDIDAPWFKDDNAAREHLEGIRWPDGPEADGRAKLRYDSREGHCQSKLA